MYNEGEKKAPLGALVYTWKVTAADGSTYSIDKLLLDFAVKYRAGQGVLDRLAGLLWVEFRHWTSYKMGTFREQFSFELPGDRSFWLGMGLNGPSGVDTRRARLELNPNKVGHSQALWYIFNALWDASGPHERVTVKRWDLAVDLPGSREEYELVKDGRQYEEMRRSAADRTQYLGQRNAPGRCKLYNKTRESGLEQLITRLELTLDGADCTPERVAGEWPTVYRVRSEEQLSLEVAALNETDRFILRTLWREPERLGELSRRKRAKLEPLLAACGRVEFDRAAYGEVLLELRRWTERRPETAAPGCPGSWKEIPEYGRS